MVITTLFTRRHPGPKHFLQLNDKCPPAQENRFFRGALNRTNTVLPQAATIATFQSADFVISLLTPYLLFTVSNYALILCERMWRIFKLKR